MAEQQFLFEVAQERRSDGSFVVRPKRMVDDQEVDAEYARRFLGYKDRETVYRLIKLRQIEGWQDVAVRGNGKYHILLGSLIDFKARRKAVARGERDFFGMS